MLPSLQEHWAKRGEDDSKKKLQYVFWARTHETEKKNKSGDTHSSVGIA